MTILWRDAMTVGVPALDADHKKFISLVNKAEEAVYAGDPAPLGDLLDALRQFCTEHFDHEEACMIALDFADVAGHARLHRAFVQNVTALRTAFAAARSPSERRKCAASAHNLLQSWLRNHILVEDLKLKPLTQRRAKQKAQETPKDTGLVLAHEVGPEQWEYRQRDEQDELPPHLADFLRPLYYICPQPPAPHASFANLESLCEDAIRYRIEKLLTFFFRHNTAIVRELPAPFLLSAEFAERFFKSLQTLIFPQMWATRRMRLLDADLDRSGLNTDRFWSRVGEQRTEHIREAWRLAWDNLRLIDSKNDRGVTVMKVKEETRQLRAELAPPTPDAYDLPKIGNREIDVFCALLDPGDAVIGRLERLWSVCEDMYVQEMTPCGKQQMGLEGAFAGSLLSACASLPAQWGDFLTLTCHRVFPRVSTGVLEKFARNFGEDPHEQEARLPYTMRYLQQGRERPEIRARELREDAAWQANMEELQQFRAAQSVVAQT